MSFSRREGTSLGAVVVALLLMLMGAPEASAATFTTTIPDTYFCVYNFSTGTTDPPNCDTVEVTLTLDKATYAPGDPIVATGAMRLLNTRSGNNNLLTYYFPGFTWELEYHKYSMTVTTNGSTQTLFDLPYGLGPWDPIGFGSCKRTGACPPSGTATFTAPNTPGTYYVSCTALISQNMDTYGIPDFDASIPSSTCRVSYTVQSAAMPNLTAGMINERTAVAGSGQVFTVLISNVGTASTTNGFFNLLQRAETYNAATRVATGISDVSYRSLLTLLGPFRPSSTQSFLSYTVPAADANTTRYFRACADRTSGNGAGQGVAESDENDNCGDWTPVVISAAPQANITALNTTPSIASPVTGANVTFAAQVKNEGTASASNVPNGFQLAFNAAKTAPYTWLTATQVATLGVPNGVANITSGSPFSTSTVGTYYVRACGNYTVSGNPPTGTRNTAISESSTTDNCDTNWVPVTVTLSPELGKANLRVFERVSPMTATVGVVTSYSVPVYNTSTDTDVTDPFYALLQRTDSIDAQGNPITPVYDVNVAGITTDVLRSGSATISVPTLAGTWSAGDAGLTRHLRICADKSSAADVDGSIVEFNTDDNCGEWTPISVAAAKPDLTAGSVYWTGGDATVNVARNYSAQISNAIAPTGVSFYNKIQVASGANGTGTITNYTTAQMAALSAGASGVATRSHQFTSVGTYSMRACADENAAGTKWVIEADENNNCSSSWVNVRACTANAGSTCQSAPNECGEVAQGIYQCDGTCSAVVSGCSVVPEVTLLATPARVPKCSNTTLTWTTKYAPNSCTITRQPATTTWPINPRTVSGVSGSTLVDAVCENTKYEITCVNAAGPSLPDSVIVNVLPDFTEF